MPIDLERTGFIIGRDLVDDRMTKGLLKLRQEFGRGEKVLAECIFKKPSRSWIASCSKGEVEDLELASMEHRC